VGYWMLFSAPHTYTFCGQVVSSRNLTVQAGWNMIGPFEQSVPVTSITSTPASILEPPLYNYQGNYNPVTTLLSGKGYWAYVKQAGTLNLPGAAGWDASLASPAIFPPETQHRSTCSLIWQTALTVADHDLSSGSLTIGQSPDATDEIDPDCSEARLPPPPPAGGFDVRIILSNGVDASLIDIWPSTPTRQIWKIQFQPGSGGYPITLTWNPANLPTGSFYLKDAITGTFVNVNMKTNSSYSLTNSGIKELLIEYQAPQCYTLTLSHTGSGSDPTALPTASTDCSDGKYVAGEPISLTAQPAVGWGVASWTGTSDNASTSLTNSLTMPASNAVVSANYVLVKHIIYIPIVRK
jgi:hypothetical protein